jgi:hypothetical protein
MTDDVSDRRAALLAHLADLEGANRRVRELARRIGRDAEWAALRAGEALLYGEPGATLRSESKATVRFGRTS